MRFTNQQKYSLGWENFNFSNFYNFISDLGEKALGRQGVNGATTIKEKGSGYLLFLFISSILNFLFWFLETAFCLISRFNAFLLMMGEERKKFLGIKEIINIWKQTV